MNLTKHLKNFTFILFFFAMVVACKPQPQLGSYAGTWMEVKKTGSAYQRVDCGYAGDILRITNDSVYHKSIMEDSDFKIDHIKQEDDQATFYADQKEQSYYKLSWIDEQRGLVTCETSIDGALTIRYFVNQGNLKNVGIVKGTKADCITNEDTGDRINESMAIGDGNKTLYVEDDNCISVRNNKNELLYNRCFEGVTLKIRYAQGNFLPLTFTSGFKSMEVNFYASGNTWISKTVTYYNDTTNKAQKQMLPMTISVKEFDFKTIANQFVKPDKPLSAGLEDLQNEAKLQDIDVYGVADILAASPVNVTNMPVYSKAAHDLIEAERYNEARIILLELVKASPQNAELFLDLGDAQWGFDNQGDAKKSYQTYLTLLKSNANDPEQVPQRVLSRTK
jgi:hypothetical protein